MEIAIEISPAMILKNNAILTQTKTSDDCKGFNVI